MNIKNWLFGRLTNSKGKPIIEMSEEMRLFFLERIEKWKDVYSGGGSWRYAKKGGLEGGYRKIGSLGCAKALCMEFAALCFSQQMDLAYSDKKIQKLVEKTLQNNDFWTCFPLFLEKCLQWAAGLSKPILKTARLSSTISLRTALSPRSTMKSAFTAESS